MSSKFVCTFSVPPPTPKVPPMSMSISRSESSIPASVAANSVGGGERVAVVPCRLPASDVPATLRASSLAKSREVLKAI